MFSTLSGSRLRPPIFPCFWVSLVVTEMCVFLVLETFNFWLTLGGFPIGTATKSLADEKGKSLGSVAHVGLEGDNVPPVRGEYAAACSGGSSQSA